MGETHDSRVTVTAQTQQPQ
uniref:Uncharacterized protein n=1 Tax=Anguilla anguilla TaxID=7936 RepID=A0A0E9RC87_ANGAN